MDYFCLFSVFTHAQSICVTMNLLCLVAVRLSVVTELLCLQFRRSFQRDDDEDTARQEG